MFRDGTLSGRSDCARSTNRRDRILRRATATTLTLGAIATSATAVRAADKSWNNSSGGSFQLDTNWTPTGAPGANDNAIFDLNPTAADDTYSVTFAADATNQRVLSRVDSVFVDLNGHTYTLTATAANTPSIFVGSQTEPVFLRFQNGNLNTADALINGKATQFDQNSQLFIGDGLTWNNSGKLTVGDTGQGAVTTTGTVHANEVIIGASGKGFFSSGGIVTSSNISIGVDSGSGGSLSESDLAWTNSGALRVGIGGGGVVSVEGTFATDTADIAVLPGSGGTIAVDNGHFDVTGLFQIGHGGQGRLATEFGHSVITTGGDAILGVDAGSRGEASLEDQSSWSIAKTITIGSHGIGTVAVFDGSSMSTAGITIAEFADSTGSAGVGGADEPSSEWTNTGSLHVGERGKGSFGVGPGATFTNTGDAVIGVHSGATGDAGVRGAGAHWINSGAVQIGGGENGGTGSFEIAGDGVLEADGGVVVKSNGKLTGNGKIIGNVTSQGGSIGPQGVNAFPPERINAGTFVIDGALSLDSLSTLEFSLGGTTQGHPDPFGGEVRGGYDFLKVSGDATIGGKLSVGFFNGFENQVKETDLFTILDADNPLVGIFKNVANGGRLKTTDHLFTFKVNYGESSAFDPSDVVLSDAQPFSGPAVPLPPMMWSGGALLAGLVATRLRMNRRAHA